jgi:hypothetical protein
VRDYGQRIDEADQYSPSDSVRDDTYERDRDREEKKARAGERERERERKRDD